MVRRGVSMIFALLVLALLVSLGGFFALYMLVGREPSVPSGAFLELRVGGELAEVAPADVFGYLREGRTPTVRTLVDNLRKAKVDDRVSAVVVKTSGFTTPFWGKIQEIRDAMIDFKESGKPLFAYLEYGGTRDFYLATAADRIFLLPSTTLELTGLASYELFLRGTLDKVGVYPDLHHIGAYKNAPNTFTERGFTETHREASLSINRDVYDELIRAIAQGRRKTEGEIRALVDQGPFLPDQARQAGLVDVVAYEDQVENEVLEGRPREGRLIEGDDYARVGLRSLGLNRGPRIAVIYAAGSIVSGRSGYDPLSGSSVGSETMVEHIRQARRDSSVRAIVLRIDSPGGSVAASDAIWRELMITRDERENRPLVASMSDLAASGGYYIAMPAHAIVAQPSTLTGSIGIFGGKFVTGGAYEKLGANIEAVSVGRRAEMSSPERPYTPDEITKVQEQLNAFYSQFVEKVAAARGRTPEQIDRIAQGRVWTGRQARDNGLVDALGGLSEAVALAKERAKIPADEEVELVVYPPRRSFYEVISDELAGASRAEAARAWLSAYLPPGQMDVLKAVAGPGVLFRRDEALAIMPLTFLR
jgi:protease-4